jgi:hypothetical protein
VNPRSLKVGFQFALRRGRTQNYVDTLIVTPLKNPHNNCSTFIKEHQDAFFEEVGVFELGEASLEAL